MQRFHRRARVGIPSAMLAAALMLAVGIAPATVDLPRDLEIELALSGLPEHLQAEATVYVRGDDGYEVAREGSNGFSCIVRQEGVTPTHFENSMIIVCYDAEGSRTLLKSDLDQGAMFAAGKSRAEIEKTIGERWEAGKYEAPGKGVAYMLSPVMRVNTPEGRSFDYIPHTMFYASGLSPADIGVAEQPDRFGYLPFITSPGKPYSMIIVPAPEDERAKLKEQYAGMIARVHALLQ